MGKVEKQFFPNSERPELIVEVTLPTGSAFATTEASVKKVEAAVRALPEAREITSYIGQGMPRFVLSFDPELPDPAFAQIVVQTADAHARDVLRIKVRKLVDDGPLPRGAGARAADRVRAADPLPRRLPGGRTRPRRHPRHRRARSATS